MTGQDVRDARAGLNRGSARAPQGPDLDRIGARAEGAATSLDVATGGRHIAPRLRDGAEDEKLLGEPIEDGRIRLERIARRAVTR